MARPSIADDAKTFLKELRKLKATVGNMHFRALLNWKDERCWKAHALLLEQGRIVRGRGRGGSVSVA